CFRAPRALLSFPTRRSSDLTSVSSRLPGCEAALLLLHQSRIARSGCPVLSPIVDATASLGASILPFPPDFLGILLHLCDISSGIDRKSTRLNSSHVKISYAV